MNIFKILFGKKSFESDTNTRKISIQTPFPPRAKDYSYMINEMEVFFKKLYKKRIEGTESDNFKFKYDGVCPGVYYGLTKYDGQINRNGTKGVVLQLPNGEIFANLERRLWKKYTNLSANDGSKWYGYYDGEYIMVSISNSKVLETHLKNFLATAGECISNSLFHIELKKRVRQFNLPDRDIDIIKAKSDKYGHDLYYCGKYQLAGVFRYVTSPFVSFGYTKTEPENSFNNKAIAIYTDNGQKVGYISEKELKKFYAELRDETTLPLVIEAHYYNNKLYGWVYTFAYDKSEYHYMVNQFLKELKR